jgi:hypothetical protein
VPSQFFFHALSTNSEPHTRVVTLVPTLCDVTSIMLPYYLLYMCVEFFHVLYKIFSLYTPLLFIRYTNPLEFICFTYSINLFPNIIFAAMCSMDLQEVGCGYVDWIGLAQDRDGWRRLVSAVMNLRVS